MKNLLTPASLGTSAQNLSGPPQWRQSNRLKNRYEWERTFRWLSTAQNLLPAGNQPVVAVPRSLKPSAPAEVKPAGRPRTQGSPRPVGTASPGTTPSPARWAGQIARCALEALDGYRPLSQLSTWVSPEVYRNLEHRQHQLRRGQLPVVLRTQKTGGKQNPARVVSSRTRQVGHDFVDIEDCGRITVLHQAACHTLTRLP